MTLCIGSFYFFFNTTFYAYSEIWVFMKTETGEKYILLNTEKYT